MKFLTEEVSFEGEEDLSPFNLAQIEALRLAFVCSSHNRIAERSNMRSEFLRVVDNLVENVLFVGLEWEAGDFVLPRL